MRKNEIGLTSEEHQGGRGREVGRRRPPASDDPGREGHEHEEEGHDEERDHGATHVWKKMMHKSASCWKSEFTKLVNL